MYKPKQEFMKAAIKEALKARKKGDYAIGAIIVHRDKIVSRGSNAVKVGHDVTKHAEIIAIRKASKILGRALLPDCVLYTTHEPCPMCASAAVFARMKGIVCGALLKDMQDFALNKGNRRWRWTTIDIDSSFIIAKGQFKPFLIRGFMRKECNQLFHT